MLNFLNVFDRREKLKILDPFVGNGTILLFALLQDFQIYGSDIDPSKVKNTIRNINWLIELLEEEIPLFIDKRILKSDVKDLSKHFGYSFFDGICTEPYLGPYFLEKPYFNQVKELFETKLEPQFNNFFREAYKILKNENRICFVAPIITTVDGNDVQLNIEKIANANNFKLVPIIDPERFISKVDPKLQRFKKSSRSLIDAKKGQILLRKVYIFEKRGK